MLEVIFALSLSVTAPAQDAATALPQMIAYMAQRRKVMALVADRDCQEMVESVCPMSAFDLARWDIYNGDALAGFYTEPQMETARRLYDAYRFRDAEAEVKPTDPEPLPRD